MHRQPLILTVYLPTLLLSFARGLLVPILPLFADSFAVSYSLIGLFLACEGLGTLLGDLPSGLLLGRLGTRRAMLLSVGGMGVSMLAMSRAQAYGEIVVYFLVFGLVSSLWNISRHAYLTDTVPPDQRGRVIAVFGGIARIGVFAGPVVGGWVGAIYGLRAAFLLYGAVAAVVLPLQVYFAGDTHLLSVAHGSGLRGRFGHMAALVRAHYSVLLKAGSGQIFAQTIRSGRQVIVPLYAADVLGLDVQTIGLIVTFAAAVDMSMFYPAGWIMDRLGRKYAYVPSFILQGVGMGLIPFAANAWGLALATGLLGFGNGLGSGTMMTLGADLSPQEARGEFLGLWRLIGDVGQTGGPFVVGGVADLLGLSAATITIACIGILAAFTLGIFVPETLPARASPAHRASISK